MGSLGTKSVQVMEAKPSVVVDWRSWATELEDYLRNKHDYDYPTVWKHVKKLEDFSK